MWSRCYSNTSSKTIHYNFDQLAVQLSPYGDIQQNPYLLSCQAEDYRLVIFQDGRVVIHGVQDIQKLKPFIIVYSDKGVFYNVRKRKPIAVGEAVQRVMEFAFQEK